MISIDYYQSIKVWFIGGVCRIFEAVERMERNRDMIKIYLADGKVHVVNWRAVNMIEEL